MARFGTLWLDDRLQSAPIGKGSSSVFDAKRPTLILSERPNPHVPDGNPERTTSCSRLGVPFGPGSRANAPKPGGACLGHTVTIPHA